MSAHKYRTADAKGTAAYDVNLKPSYERKRAKPDGIDGIAFVSLYLMCVCVEDIARHKITVFFVKHIFSAPNFAFCHIRQLGERFETCNTRHDSV